jgi:hypothetical protein
MLHGAARMRDARMWNMFLRGVLATILISTLCVAQATAPQTPATTQDTVSSEKRPQKVSEHSSGCHGLDGGELHKLLENGYILNIRPAPDSMEALCWAEIDDSSGREAFGLNNYAVGLHDASGRDINGDGKPDLVIEGTTGGHCCWTYVIVSPTPVRKLAQLTNERTLDFTDRNGRMTISGQDGVFDFFQGSPSFSPRADVFLQVDGTTLRDAAGEFRADYDRQIADARKKITPQALEKFRNLGALPDNAEVRAAILTVVLEYLYSGREQEAWKALAETWPESTRDKVKKLIIDTKARGILSALSALPAPNGH